MQTTKSVKSDDRCRCGNQATHGAHAIIDGKLVSFDMCDRCYHAQEYAVRREDEV